MVASTLARMRASLRAGLHARTGCHHLEPAHTQPLTSKAANRILDPGNAGLNARAGEVKLCHSWGLGLRCRGGGRVHPWLGAREQVAKRRNAVGPHWSRPIFEGALRHPSVTILSRLRAWLLQACQKRRPRKRARQSRSLGPLVTGVIRSLNH